MRFTGVCLRVRYDVWVDLEVSEVPARRIAELIAEGFGNRDVLIFGHDIARSSLSNTGRVD